MKTLQILAKWNFASVCFGVLACSPSTANAQCTRDCGSASTTTPFVTLHSFTGGADGGQPEAGLIQDAAGNLYGTTEVGGAANFGVVFKLDTTGKETVLYSFTGGTDGAHPRGRFGPGRCGQPLRHHIRGWRGTLQPSRPELQWRDAANLRNCFQAGCVWYGERVA
jgi:uncharacterized repeat protein (TIGR03803 family)